MQWLPGMLWFVTRNRTRNDFDHSAIVLSACLCLQRSSASVSPFCANGGTRVCGRHNECVLCLSLRILARVTPDQETTHQCCLSAPVIQRKITTTYNTKCLTHDSDSEHRLILYFALQYMWTTGSLLRDNGNMTTGTSQCPALCSHLRASWEFKCDWLILTPQPPCRACSECRSESLKVYPRLFKNVSFRHLCVHFYHDSKSCLARTCMQSYGKITF